MPSLYNCVSCFNKGCECRTCRKVVNKCEIVWHINNCSFDRFDYTPCYIPEKDFEYPITTA